MKKKILVMLLTAVMIFTMTACTGGTPEGPVNQKKEEAKEVATVEETVTEAEEEQSAAEEEKIVETTEAEAESEVEAGPEAEAESESQGVPDDFYGRTADGDTWGIAKFNNPDMDTFIYASVVPGRSGTTSDMIECSLSWKPDGDSCKAVEYHIGQVDGDSLESAMDELLSQGNMQAYASGDPVSVTHGGVDCLELAQSLVLHSDTAKDDTGYWGVFEKDGQYYKYYYEIHKDCDDSWGDTLFELVYDSIMVF